MHMQQERDANRMEAWPQQAKASKGSNSLARRTSIRTRLSLVLGLLLWLTLIIAIVAYNSLNSGQQAVEYLLEGEAVIARDAQKAQIAMLQTRRAEKDYLLRFKQLGFAKARELYVQRFEQQVKVLSGILRDLATHSTEISKFGDRNTIKTGNLQHILDQYRMRFLNVVKLYEKRGYVDSGLEGQFRTAVHAIEKDVRMDHPHLLASLLQMRRHEKDYLLRGDDKYIDLLHQQGKAFKVGLGKHAPHSINITDTYLAGFDQLVAVDKQIIAGIASFRAAVHQLEPEFDELIKHGEASAKKVKHGMQDAATLGKRWVLFVSVLALLLGFGAAFWLSRSITRPVEAISQAVNQLAEGDLTQRVLVSGQDEISYLGQSFNDMADELQRSIRDMEQFAYVASHDLQEPLRMVASYTELLAKRYQGQLDERADKYIHYASDGARRMQMLIDALLTYSRVGTKGGELVPTHTSQVVKEALKNLEAVIQESGANIKLGRLPTVLADRIQLSQLFQNLIGNALKYRGEAAAPDIHVNAKRLDGMIQFSIADNGIGIAPEFHERIFQIFQRLHERGQYDGTGLGLALAKKIVERHGGKIWLESKEGEGAVFNFTLPTGHGGRDDNTNI